MKSVNHFNAGRIPDTVQEKYEKLQNILTEMKKLVVAFSGGVDSSFLLKVAYDVLGENVLAVTLKSEVMSKREIKEAQELAGEMGVSIVFLDHSALDNPDFVKNTPLRCYHCKKDEFAEIQELAISRGFSYVADGSNSQDAEDYRPGAKALMELGIRSPLKEAGFRKDEIRLMSRMLGLPTWNKPAMACLASRFPYHTKIEEEGLNKVAGAEEFLRDMGFTQVRVRHHDSIARIEILKEQFPLILEAERANEIAEFIKNLGYSHVTLDIRGYRMGSLNESLGLKKDKN